MGRRDEVEEPERVVVVVERIATAVSHGWPRYHQRVWPAGYIADQVNFSHARLEERFDKECHVSRTKHPPEITGGVDEWDRSVLIIPSGSVSGP